MASNVQNARLLVNDFDEIRVSCNFALEGDCLVWFVHCRLDHLDFVLEADGGDFPQRSFYLLVFIDQRWRKQVANVKSVLFTFHHGIFVELFVFVSLLRKLLLCYHLVHVRARNSHGHVTFSYVNQAHQKVWFFIHWVWRREFENFFCISYSFRFRMLSEFLLYVVQEVLVWNLVWSILKWSCFLNN